MSRSMKKEEEEDDDDLKDPSVLLAKGFTNGILNTEYQEPLSRFFRFPFRTAYDIQLNSAYFIYKAIETRKVAVLESPTGTGKTFILICGAASWLTMQVKEQKLRNSEFNENHNDKKRSKYERSTASALSEDFFNRVKPKIELSYEDEPYNYDSSTDPSRIDNYKREPFFQSQSDVKVSDSSEPLQEQFKQDQKHNEPLPRLIYVTRTHSQIHQFITELKKTEFGEMFSIGGVSLRTVAFASRKQMCINEKVQEILYCEGMEAMNETCLELKRNRFKNEQEKRKNKNQAKLKEICGWLPCTKDGDDQNLKEYEGTLRQQPRDIEEAVRIGESLGVCPYYGSREAGKQAQLIVMTYENFLNASTRRAIGVEIHNSVVIIDEAHNIIDKILQINSIVLTESQVEKALLLLELCLSVAKRVKTFKHERILSELRSILYRLDAFCKERMNKEKTIKKKIPMSPANFIAQSVGTIDPSLLHRLKEWLNDDDFDWQNRGNKEVNNETESNEQGKAKEKEAQLNRQSRSAKIVIRSIEAFLLLLTNQKLEGRIHIPDPRAKSNTTEKWSLKYQLLDPATTFKEIVDQARCVILAGGTMKPISDFTHQLFPQLEKDRFVHLECSHIVPKENIFGAKVSYSQKGKELKYNFNNRAGKDTLGELLEMLIEFSKVIPDGIVVFVSSYVYLGRLREYWNRCTDDYNRLQGQKSVFFEPQDSSADKVLEDYKEAIDLKKGAILFAVVNAKLSEGINFKDEMGRAVIVVGLPYAFYEDPELMERQGFVRKLHKRLQSEGKDIPLGYDAGRELYVNTCMKSVSQSIGRVIRHQNDYAAIILLDSRYEEEKHNTRLPSWIRESTNSFPNFDVLMDELQKFFQNKSYQSLT